MAADGVLRQHRCPTPDRDLLIVRLCLSIGPRASPAKREEEGGGGGKKRRRRRRERWSEGNTDFLMGLIYDGSQHPANAQSARSRGRSSWAGNGEEPRLAVDGFAGFFFKYLLREKNNNNNKTNKQKKQTLRSCEKQHQTDCGVWIIPGV